MRERRHHLVMLPTSCLGKFQRPKTMWKTFSALIECSGICIATADRSIISRTATAAATTVTSSAGGRQRPPLSIASNAEVSIELSSLSCNNHSRQFWQLDFCRWHDADWHRSVKHWFFYQSEFKFWAHSSLNKSGNANLRFWYDSRDLGICVYHNRFETYALLRSLELPDGTRVMSAGHLPSSAETSFQGIRLKMTGEKVFHLGSLHQMATQICQRKSRLCSRIHHHRLLRAHEVDPFQLAG